MYWNQSENCSLYQLFACITLTMIATEPGSYLCTGQN